MSCPAGKTRNRSTGRCRKSCKKHQAINPETGQCVSKTYLKRIQRQSFGDSDFVYDPALYDSELQKDYNDGLVPDAACYPRKRNIYTGRCRTPCGPGRAINPATDRCVSLGYLRRCNPLDYDTDGDCEMAAAITFTPTDLASKIGIFSPYDNDVTKKDLFKKNMVTENDLVVMESAFHMQDKTEQYTNNLLSGTYSPDERKNGCPATRTGFTGGNLGASGTESSCGLGDVGKQKPLVELMRENQDRFTFVALGSNYGNNGMVPYDVIMQLPKFADETNVRFLVATRLGVWRILIPQATGEANVQLSVGLTVVAGKMHELMTSMQETKKVNPRKVAAEISKVAKVKNDFHISFAPYAEK